MDTREMRREMNARGLENCTPVEIDTVLSELWGKQQTAQHRIERLQQTKADILADGNNARRTGWATRTARDGVRLCDDLATAIEDLAVLKAESLPYENEYVRRGGWSRYFLVQNDNGHIHSSMTCSTCNREGQLTRFGWMIELSGTAAEDLTAEVGPNACTVCFPWAETIRQEADATARRERAALKEMNRQAKEDLAKEKGITTPEGQPVYDGEPASHNQLKTLRAAEIAATDALFYALLHKRHDEDPETHRDASSGYRTWAQIAGENAFEAAYLVRAIAFKKDQSFEETLTAHLAKAEAKLRKADREWAKDPRNPKNRK